MAYEKKKQFLIRHRYNVSSLLKKVLYKIFILHLKKKPKTQKVISTRVKSFVHWTTFTRRTLSTATWNRRIFYSTGMGIWKSPILVSQRNSPTGKAPFPYPPTYKLLD